MKSEQRSFRKEITERAAADEEEKPVSQPAPAVSEPSQKSKGTSGISLKSIFGGKKSGGDDGPKAGEIRDINQILSKGLIEVYDSKKAKAAAQANKNGPSVQNPKVAETYIQ